MELLIRSHRQAAHPENQRGVVLFVTLIILILMTLATLSVVRSMDTGNVISGNFAFKQAVAQVSDRGITDAMNNLATITAGGNGNTDIDNRYFSTRQATTAAALGVPSTVNWTNVSCADETGAAVVNCDTNTGKYRVQYIIERQCSSNPSNLNSATDIKTNCDYEVRTPASAGPPAVTEQIAVRYRIIIRARGPRDANGLYEVMVSGPA